ncbi:MAG TPA: hypothetical protein VMZ04_09835 [Anaerolineae bacterium]|nr:hypothetical protein [Anaerolineae bacterium]
MQKKRVEKKDLSKNVKFYYAAVAVIILGYIILSIGDADSFTSLTLGPIILVVGYLIIIPLALLSGVRKKDGNKELSDTKK